MMLFPSCSIKDTTRNSNDDKVINYIEHKSESYTSNRVLEKKKYSNFSRLLLVAGILLNKIYVLLSTIII